MTFIFSSQAHCLSHSLRETEQVGGIWFYGVIPLTATAGGSPVVSSSGLVNFKVSRQLWDFCTLPRRQCLPLIFGFFNPVFTIFSLTNHENHTHLTTTMTFSSKLSLFFSLRLSLSLPGCKFYFIFLYIVRLRPLVSPCIKTALILAELLHRQLHQLPASQ